MDGYKWQCPRCAMKFVERNGELGKAGKCNERGCEVIHAVGSGRKGWNCQIWVRPGQTADLRRIEQ